MVRRWMVGRQTVRRQRKAESANSNQETAGAGSVGCKQGNRELTMRRGRHSRLTESEMADQNGPPADTLLKLIRNVLTSQDMVVECEAGMVLIGVIGVEE